MGEQEASEIFAFKLVFILINLFVYRSPNITIFLAGAPPLVITAERIILRPLLQVYLFTEILTVAL